MAGKLSGLGKRRASPGNGQNKWTYEQKLSLRLMFVEFGFTLEPATAVFNELYADHLRTCGLPSGLEVSAIKSQYNERDRPSASKVWRTICNNAVDVDEVVRRKRVSSQIIRAAASLQTVTPDTRLSSAKQPPVSTPSPTLTPSKRARGSSRGKSTIFHNIEDSPKRKNKSVQAVPRKAMVVISKKEREDAVRGLSTVSVTTPRKTRKTPKSPRSSSSRRKNATISYRLPSGTEIWLTLDQYRETQTDLVPIPDAVAHPPVPLLFRYSSDDSQSPLTENGFCAGRFATTIIPPPRSPSLCEFPWSCAAQHLNRDRKIASPFISTSNNFVWIIRLALKEATRGAVGGRISLINPSVLDRRAIFHAQPIHRELCKKKPFDNAAFLYHGMNEFLIWASIPKKAIISTFPVEMLFGLANSNPGVGAILRLEQIGLHRTGYYSKILPAFKEQNMTLRRSTIIAIATVCQALGLNVSMVEAVSSVVSDIIKGFGIILQHKSEEEWQFLASIFTDMLCAQNLRPPTLSDREGMKYAFLDGCRWASGDFNPRQKPNQMKTMLGRAKNFGLDSPEEILMSGLESARLRILSYEQKQQALFRGSASRALLAEPDEDEQILPIAGMESMRITPDLADEDYDLVGNSDDEEEHIVYDFDEDVDGSVYEL